MSRTSDLTIVQGTDVSVKVFIQDIDGNSIDINAKQFTGGMKKNYTDTATIDFTTNVVDANTGIITINLTNAQTTSLDPNTRYVYDVIMYESGNTAVQRILDGKVIVKPAVSTVGA